MLLDLVHEAGFGNFDEANSAEFLHCLVLTWTQHCKAKRPSGPPALANFIFALGERNWFWRQLICICTYIYNACAYTCTNTRNYIIIYRVTRYIICMYIYIHCINILYIYCYIYMFVFYISAHVQECIMNMNINTDMNMNRAHFYDVIFVCCASPTCMRPSLSWS